VRAVVAAVLLVLFAGACGDNGTEITQDGSKLLHAQIAGARAAAAQGDYARAKAGLRAVETTVSELRKREWVTDRKAAEILAAVGATEDALAPYMTAVVATPTTSAPPPTKQDTGEHGGNDRGKAKKGKGD
jgi:hypothetical protein